MLDRQNLDVNVMEEEIHKLKTQLAEREKEMGRLFFEKDAIVEQKSQLVRDKENLQAEMATLSQSQERYMSMTERKENQVQKLEDDLHKNSCHGSKGDGLWEL